MATSGPKQGPPPEGTPGGLAQGGQERYLRLMTEQLMGWDDPRAMLERALKDNQFLLLAQKILSVKSGNPEPVCYEVLLRLKQEEENLLPPGGFLDLADSLGVMEKIDRWVLGALLSWAGARLRRSAGSPLPMMCLNLSAAAVTSPAFAAAVREELAKSRFPARALCFEISEREAIERHKATRNFIQALRPAGCRFTMDAFGSAKVSFSHFKDLALDFVKIDGVIIQNIARDPLALVTAKVINTVCHELGVRTIAEFVETKEILDKVREIGVDYVQGFGIARPEPIGQVP